MARIEMTHEDLETLCREREERAVAHAMRQRASQPLTPSPQRLGQRDMTRQGYDSPEAMVEAMRQAYYARNEHAPLQHLLEDSQRLRPGMRRPSHLINPFAAESPSPLQETDQAPHQWNLVTLTRCVVTRQEYHHYGSVEAVLARKNFPTSIPEDGSILLSWFDAQEGAAYYELARVQDQGELARYMLEHFHPEPAPDDGRLVELP